MDFQSSFRLLSLLFAPLREINLGMKEKKPLVRCAPGLMAFEHCLPLACDRWFRLSFIRGLLEGNLFQIIHSLELFLIGHFGELLLVVVCCLHATTCATIAALVLLALCCGGFVACRYLLLLRVRRFSNGSGCL